MSDRLQEIRARLDAATPGPWRILHHDLCCGESWVRDESGYHVGTSLYSNDEKRDENLSLIAHAPADIAWLLDEVERLRESCDVERAWRETQ